MLSNLPAIGRETCRAFCMTRGISSRFRAAFDVLVSRFLRFFKLPSYNQPRTIEMADGSRITYRMNRGDVQGLREVWMDGCYRLPFAIEPKIVVDLGANIGLTSLWLHRQYHCQRIIAVEALEANAELVEQNFMQNKLPGTVIHAAIGPRDGVAVFECRSESNVGRIAAAGEDAKEDVAFTVQVPMTSMDAICAMLEPGQRIDLVKLDIEGGEEALFSENLGWLQRVDAIIAELHPGIADCDKVVAALKGAGFAFLQTGQAFDGSPSSFIRRDHPAAASIRLSA